MVIEETHDLIKIGEMIENLRKKLNKVVNEKENHLDSTIVRLSMELDVLIVRYIKNSKERGKD